MARKTVDLTDLDFDGIKSALVAHMESQSNFSGYNFEGSGLNVLMNLLAYNTSMTAYMANMLGNEMFLDTSTLRTSAVSHAKLLGYTPTSPTAASATISLVLNASSGITEINLTKNTLFSSTIDGVSYTFVPDQAYATTRNSQQFTASSVVLKQGTRETFQYIVTTQDTEQKFIIPSNKADTSELTVTIQNSIEDSTQEVFTLSTDINTLTGSSAVYWLQETDNGYFEVTFGDGIIGKALTDGNMVILEYLLTEGPDANGATTFTLTESIGGDSTGVITTIDNAGGGANIQSLQSVKFLAPLIFETQNRAVTANDYEATILANYSSIGAVRCWGGEEGDPRLDGSPPVYGKVFISLKPASGYTVSNTLKASIKSDVLATRNILSVIPEFIDPEYVFIQPTINLRYNGNATNLPARSLANKVTAIVEDYSDTDLDQYNSLFRFSKLSRLIDAADDAILSNNMTIKMMRRVSPTVGTTAQYSIKFANAIYHPSSNHPAEISSNAFTYYNPATTTNVTAYLEDNDGVIRIFRYSDTEKIDVVSNAGSVNYITGEIILTNFAPISLSSTYLEIRAKPNINDLTPGTNILLFVNSADITVTTTKESL